jgi:hypothetical protein
MYSWKAPETTNVAMAAAAFGRKGERFLACCCWPPPAPGAFFSDIWSSLGPRFGDAASSAPLTSVSDS